MLIVDGHNLIGACKNLNFDDPQVQEKLLAKLKKYKTIMDVKIIVVFDGADKIGFGRYVDDNIEILFPDENQIADDIIINLCKKYSHARDTVIVSSDHEIKDAARKAGLIPKNNTIFARELYGVVGKFDHQQQTKEYLSPMEVKEWLKYFEKK